MPGSGRCVELTEVHQRTEQAAQVSGRSPVEAPPADPAGTPPPFLGSFDKTTTHLVCDTPKVVGKTSEQVGFVKPAKSLD